jgi:hypothetical protein
MTNHKLTIRNKILHSTRIPIAFNIKCSVKNITILTDDSTRIPTDNTVFNALQNEMNKL